MQISKTEKKHWVNGYRINGVAFKSYAINIFNIGIILFWGKTFNKIVYPYIKLYKLN